MMTAKQYREAIKALGLNIIQSASFFGVSERASRYYASRGTRGATEMLLRLMIAKDISVAEVNRLMKRKELLR